MKVKICGLTNKEDAVWALNAGADYLGINFYKKSVRHVAYKSASWVLELPGFANKIGVFVDEDLKVVADTVLALKLKGVQLHGHESVEAVRLLRSHLASSGTAISIIKAFRVKDLSSLELMAPYVDVADYFLLDTYVEQLEGGTGQIFDWNVAVKAKDFGKPLFLAGGLKVDNVKDAISVVHPFAVDVASGVEKSPKKKDFEKMKRFVENSKSS